MPSTALLALPYPASTDADDVPLHMQNLASAVEVIFADQGALSALPSTPLRGRRYFATDKGVELRGDGTSWTSVGLSKAGGDTVLASGAGVVPLTLKLASGQTANALEVRNNANALIASIDPAGGTTVGGALSSGAHTVTSPAAGTVGLAVVLAPSPTANAVEVRSSAAVVLASVSAAGAIAGSSAAIAGPVVTSPSAAQVGLKVQLAASASGAALEVRNSSNTLMASIDATGAASLPSAAISGQLTTGSAVASPGLSQVGVRVQLPASATLAALDVRSSTNAVLAQIGPEGAIYGSTNNATGFGGLFDGTVSGSTGLMGRATHAGAHAVIARVAAGATATAFEVQSSAGVLLSAIEATGKVSASNGLFVQGRTGDNSIFVIHTAAAQVAQIIRGATSQTANLQEWQSAGGAATLASINKDGALSAPYVAITNNFSGFQQPLVVIGASGQSAALTEWRNNGGTALAAIGADGGLSIKQSAGTVLLNSNGNGPMLGMQAYVTSQSTQIIRAMTAQSAPLLETQNDIGGRLLSINPAGQLVLGQSVTPATVSGYSTLFMDTANNLYWKSPAGNLRLIASN